MRVRGLKRAKIAEDIGALMSHPVRVRGLKQIELLVLGIKDEESHPVRVRGLKLDDAAAPNAAIQCRTPCGCVG